MTFLSWLCLLAIKMYNDYSFMTQLLWVSLFYTKSKSPKKNCWFPFYVQVSTTMIFCFKKQSLNADYISMWCGIFQQKTHNNCTIITHLIFTLTSYFKKSFHFSTISWLYLLASIKKSKRQNTRFVLPWP